MDRRPRLAGVVALVGAAVTIAACGGSGTSGGATTASADSSPIALSRCMRAHGVTGFPDPSEGSGGEGFSGIGIPVGGTGSLVVDGQTFSGPVVAAAERACARYLEPNEPPPPLTADQKRRILASARCMRAHGVPNFPDPSFSGGAVRIGGGPQLNSQSPAFQRAMRVCHGGGDFRIGGPGG